VEYQTIGFSQWILSQNASIMHTCLHKDGDRALVLRTQGITLGAHASFESVQIALGGAYRRMTTWATFQGEKAHLALRGSSLLRDTQHQDTTLFVEHTTPDCTSEELFKTVVDDHATGVFQGKVIVQQKAQKTDGKMLSAALLLSENATMNNKPELEIFADDVRCGHGATCGTLDEEALFYARARGLSKNDAEALLLDAFISDVFDHIQTESIHTFLSEAITDWLAVRREKRSPSS
jgi:Fe-S cluster assembly protein SufD